MKFGLSRKARFDRYFEGYEKRVVIDRNGEEKTKFVYTLDYYRPQMSRNSFIIRKVIYAALFIIAAVLQLFAGLRSEIPMNFVKYMGFAQCLGILAMILIVIYIGIYLGAAYTMDIRTYKGSHEKFVIASLISSIALAAIFLFGLGTMIFLHSYTLMSFIWAFCYIAAAACIFVMWILEKKTVYDRIPPDEAGIR